MEASKNFLTPRRRLTIVVSWVSIVVVGLFAAALLIQSYRVSGIDMEWRISAGVSAVAFCIISLLTFMKYPPGIVGFTRRSMVACVFLATGIVLFVLISKQQSEWAQSVLLESGISCLFIAAIDVLLGAVRTAAREEEQWESDFYDEVALAVGISLDLRLYEYWAIRDSLDYAVSKGRGRTLVDRIAMLLRYSSKARNLPVRLGQVPSFL